jgi:hypothetical protein
MTNYDKKRAKKQNRLNKQGESPDIRLLQSLLDIKVLKCVSCGSERRRVGIDQLPKNFREQLPELRDTCGEIDYFLYCPDCDEYSVLFKSEIC